MNIQKRNYRKPTVAKVKIDNGFGMVMASLSYDNGGLPFRSLNPLKWVK